MTLIGCSDESRMKRDFDGGSDENRLLGNSFHVRRICADCQSDVRLSGEHLVQ